MKAYAVVTGKARFDLALQIIEYSLAAAKREVRDLKAMGCEDARVKEFASESEAYAWVEKNS